MSVKPRIAIVGTGCTRYGDRLDAGLKELFAEAWFEARDSVDRSIEPRDVDEAFIASMGSSGPQIGNLAGMLVDACGLRGIPAVRVENACASGGYALRMAIASLLSGESDLALVGGVEKMREVSGEHSRRWLGVGGDTEWERWHGLTFPGVFALMARRHMHEYGTTREHLAAVAVKNHRHGARNPKAFFRNEIKTEDALRAPRVADPLGLYDCCPTADGAAAALVCRAEDARRYTDTPIYVAGWGAATDSIAAFQRETLTTFPATLEASRRAYKMASIGPKDVDLAELHDCFTPAEIVTTEDLGFCPKGQGGPFIAEGQTTHDGAIPINVSGGLKAKGHPIGATGVGQLYELFHQLRGDAGPGRQVPGAETALAHIMGGFCVSCAVTILKT